MRVKKIIWQTAILSFKILKFLKITNIKIRGNSLGNIVYYYLSPLFKPRSDSPVKIGEYLMYITSNHSVFPGMYLGSQGQDGITRLLNNILRDGMVVFDIGAHIGFYTVIAAKKVTDKGKVYAIEPDPSNYETLIKNIALNKCQNITALQIAVADKEGKAPLYLAPDSGQHSLYRTFQKDQILVKVSTIDSIIRLYKEQHIDLIIMDIEGGEDRALDGASLLLRHELPLAVIMEFSPRLLNGASVDPVAFITKLRNLGFNILKIDETGECLPFDEVTYVAHAGYHDFENLFCTRSKY